MSGLINFSTTGIPLAVIDTLIMEKQKIITRANSYEHGKFIAKICIPYADIFKSGGYIQFRWLTGVKFEFEEIINKPLLIPTTAPAGGFISEFIPEELLLHAKSRGGKAGFYYKYIGQDSKNILDINKPNGPDDSDPDHKLAIVTIDLSDIKITLLPPELPDFITKTQKNIIYLRDIAKGIPVSIPTFSGAAEKQKIKLFVNSETVKEITLDSNSNLVKGKEEVITVDKTQHNFTQGQTIFSYTVTLPDNRIIESPMLTTTYEMNSPSVNPTGPFDIYLSGPADHHQLGTAQGQSLLTALTSLNDRNIRWKKVSKGGCTHLAISDADKVYSWGFNSEGQAGVGRYDDVQTPTLCEFGSQGSHPKTIKEVATAFYYSLLLDGDGYIWGAGNNDRHAMGSAINDAKKTIFQRLDERKYKFISADIIHQESHRGFTTYAIDLLGDLYRCGYSDYKVHLPTVGDEQINNFTRVELLTQHKWNTIVHHRYFAAATTTTGDLYTWGLNERGTLGTGESDANFSAPQKVTFPEENVRISKVALGFRHSLALDENGKLWVWGQNAAGCLGNGTNNGEYLRPRPLKVNSDQKIIDIAAGKNVSAAVTETGQLYTWGNNDFAGIGQFPAGREYTTPTQVSFEEKVAAVTFGYLSIFILSTGEALA